MYTYAFPDQIQASCLWCVGRVLEAVQEVASAGTHLRKW